MQKDKTLHNEWEQINKLLIPYIKDLGFSENEVVLEKTFSLKFGRSTIVIGKQNYRNNAGARLDILCKSKIDGKPLFIIEAKDGDVTISQDDIDQGISYARLTDPITPFVIVTNGKETRVVDTTSKQKLNGTSISTQSDFWKNDCMLSAEDDIKHRFEALQNFIGYSVDNVREFSRVIVDTRMSPLKGGQDNLNKKYIPELFVERQEIRQAFEDFLTSSCKCFALIGESGVGKTNSMCNLAELSVQNHLTLFFNASELVNGLSATINDDFNWCFSAYLAASDLFRRLDALAQGANTDVLIFVDAIDEAPRDNFPLELNEFILRIQDFRRIRVVVSCKSNDWGRFLENKGTPTTISESVYSPQKSANGTDIGLDQNRPKRVFPGVILKRFRTQELNEAEKYYRAIFKFSGELSAKVRQDCNLGLLLRILAEVYQGKELPKTIDDLSLFERYLDEKFKKLDRRDIAESILIAIGNAMLAADDSADQGSALWHSLIEEDLLRRQIGLSPTEILPSELFSHFILERIEIDGIKYINFYFTKVRDFVIAIKALRLHTLDAKSLKHKIPELMKGPMGQDALSWYATVANAAHKEVYLQHYELRALQYLDEYVRIIELHFPNIKNRFEPYTDGKIGIVAVHPNLSGHCGFFPIYSDRQSKVEILDVDDYNAFDKRSIELGCQVTKNMWGSFHRNDPKWLAREDIKHQLEKIVKNGELDESQCLAIAMEKIIAITYRFADKLGFQAREGARQLPIIDDLLPLDCDDLLDRTKFIFAREYFREEAIQKGIKTGQIPVQRMGNGFSYSPADYLYEHFEEIEQQSRNAVLQGIPIPSQKISGDFPPLTALDESVKIVKQYQQKIEKSLLPIPHCTIEEMYQRMQQKGQRSNWVPNIICAQFSDEEMKLYIEKFFNLALKEYRILVEASFPTLKDVFPMYAAQPFAMYIEVFTEISDHWRLWIGYDNTNKSDTIYVSVNPTNPKIKDDKKRFPIIIGQNLDRFFHTYPSIPLQKGIKDSAAGRFCVIRSYVYELIDKELKHLFKAMDGL